ncbi:MAG: SlyX family protein [Planctomycetota bacterium]|nr:SlyX family protein [Planctomycetota bacterium]
MPDQTQVPGSIEQRLQSLEVGLAHLQRLNEQLNEVVTQQAFEADKVNRRIERLETQVKEFKEKQRAGESIDPLDEKPPHY